MSGSAFQCSDNRRITYRHKSRVDKTPEKGNCALIFFYLLMYWKLNKYYDKANLGTFFLHHILYNRLIGTLGLFSRQIIEQHSCSWNNISVYGLYWSQLIAQTYLYRTVSYHIHAVNGNRASIEFGEVGGDLVGDREPSHFNTMVYDF